MVGLRKQIKIVDVSPFQDGNGFMKANEIVLFFGWAEISATSSLRSFFIGQDSLSHTKTFRIRNHQGIAATVNTRIIYDGKQYTVNSIEKEKEKGFYYIIRASAKTDN
jgi:hypothetical protein